MKDLLTGIFTELGPDFSNLRYEVRWSTVDSRWEIRFDFNNNGTYSTVTYYNTTATAPNPPSLGLGTWVDAGTNCGALTAFSGSGTQVPPGAETIDVATANNCVIPPDPDMTWFGSEGAPSRNIYRGSSDFSFLAYEVRWSAVDNRWEIRFDANDNGTYTVVTYYNTLATAPNPPALGLGTWVDAGTNCGALTTFSGSGTELPAAPIINVATANGCVPDSEPAMVLFGSEGAPTRNIYRGNSFFIVYEVRWSVVDNRWEFRYEAEDEDGIPYWVVTHYNTTATAPNPPALGLGTWVEIGMLCGALTTFSGRGTQLVLPVELLHFSATTERGKNTLTWSTASETNNRAFDIERSTDGRAFKMLGQIKAANKPSNYQFIDDQPLVTSYYRLRQTDLDGTATYSKIVSVTLRGTKGLKVYPTLVTDGFLTVDTEVLETVDFSIYNLVGQPVQRGQIHARLDVSALPTGTYMLQVGSVQTKFVKP